MAVSIERVRDEQFEDWIRAIELAFGRRTDPAEVERWRPLFISERAIAARDEGRVVGTAASERFELTVPGGSVNMGGVLAVAVAPTHRRRGILRRMMLQQLRDCRDLGDPMTGLWASESAIYGRFGYGMAAPTAEVGIERVHARFRHDEEPAGVVEIVDRDRALELIPPIHESLRPTRPGFYTIRPERWRAEIEDLEDFSKDATLFFAVHRTDGAPDGFALYRLKRDWTEGVPHGTNVVRSLLATNPAAEVDLWRYCLGIDLMGRVEAWPCPIDTPIWHRLVDPRRLSVRIQDGLWLRLLDVPACLAARRYGVQGRLVLGIRDDVLDWVDGTYELDAGPDGVSSSRSDDEPDVVLEARDLAATYLGAVRFSTLAQAGLAAGDPDAIRRADAMFASSPVGFCPFVF